MKILILNGPNINMTGIREQSIYGTKTMGDMMDTINEKCENLKIECEFYQSNIEGELINKIQKTHFNDVDGIIFNPGAYSHYSLALSDCIKSVATPVVEVHISNVFSRGSERYNMVTARNSVGLICGFGINSYLVALEGLIMKLNEMRNVQ